MYIYIFDTSPSNPNAKNCKTGSHEQELTSVQITHYLIMEIMNNDKTISQGENAQI